jgi:hypothetical protein
LRSATTTAPRTIGPRELLDLYGVDGGTLGKFVDGQPISGDEREPLLKILYAVRRFSLVEIDRWAESNVALSQLIDAPIDSRGKLYRIQGVLAQVATEQPDPASADRFELPRYSRCEILAEPSRQPLTVYTLTVPNAWSSASSAKGGRVSFAGFFVKLAGAEDRPEPVFVAQRVAWHPRDPLGDLGMDFGLLDPIRDNTREAITSAEREGFYQLLHCVESSDTTQLMRLAEQNVNRLKAAVREQNPALDHVDSAMEVAVFNEPQNHRGELFLIQGTARRTTLIRVADADITARLGIDHYYQMEVFTAGSQGNPLVICLRELPQGMPQGDNIYEQVRIPAFLLKKWAYRLPGMNGGAATNKPAEPRLQLAPLLVARTAIWLPAEPRNPLEGLFTGLLVLLMLAAAWWAVWRYVRSDRQFRQRRIAPLFESEGKSLNELVD